MSVRRKTICISIHPSLLQDWEEMLARSGNIESKSRWVERQIRQNIDDSFDYLKREVDNV